MRWKANVTVAAVIENDNRFLVIEENADGKTVFNQPAGHLEKGETLEAAVIREVLEETARDFKPLYVIGIYLYTSPNNDTTYLRVCFSGRCMAHYPDRALDSEIIRAEWMTREEIAARKDDLRSPLVLHCIDDYISGKQYPLDLLAYIKHR